METLKKPKSHSKQKNTVTPTTRETKPFLFWKLAIAILVLFLVGLASKKKDFLVVTDQGLKIAPWRQKKLKKELENFDKAEQYALIATVAGEYPCFVCGESTTIYLEVGEVWKYGVTRIGKDKRYSNVPIDPRLRYLVEYKGDIGTCLRLEKIKIYQYAELPENIKRASPLIRPPGNKYDS